MKWMLEQIQISNSNTFEVDVRTNTKGDTIKSKKEKMLQ